MSEPGIPNDLRLDPHRLDDILRYFQGSGQWILDNFTHRTKLSATQLADFLAHLHHAGLVRMACYDNGWLCYDNFTFLTSENLRAPLTRDQIEPLLAKVCAKAEEMNRLREEGSHGHESSTRGVLRLLDHYGPFRLAYFETLFRAADMRASILAKTPQGDDSYA